MTDEAIKEIRERNEDAYIKVRAMFDITRPAITLTGAGLLRIATDIDVLLAEVERLTASVNCSFCDSERDNGTGPFCSDHVSAGAMREGA